MPKTKTLIKIVPINTYSRNVIKVNKSLNIPILKRNISKQPTVTSEPSIDYCEKKDSRPQITIDLSSDSHYKPWENIEDRPIYFIKDKSRETQANREADHGPLGDDMPANASTEVVWLPSASLDDMTLLLENEDIEPFFSDDDDDDTISWNDSDNDYEKKAKTSHLKTYNMYKRIRTNLTGNYKAGDVVTISKLEFCAEWFQYQNLPRIKQEKNIFDYLSSKLKPKRVFVSRRYIKSLISIHSFQLAQMWKESGGNKELFNKICSHWLKGPPIKLSCEMPEELQPTSKVSTKPLVQVKIETNADAFIFLKNFEPPFKADGLLSFFTNKQLNPDNRDKLDDFCKRYVSDMKFKWCSANNKEDIFYKKFSCWLDLQIKWPVFIKGFNNTQDTSSDETVTKETKESNTSLITSTNCLDQLAMKIVFKCDISTIERILANKCLEKGHDVSKIIHRVIHHPEDAVLVKGVLTGDRECGCDTQPDNITPDKDKTGKIKKFKPPSQEQKKMLQKTIETLKVSTQAQCDSESEPQVIKKRIPTLTAQNTMLANILQKLKVKSPKQNIKNQDVTDKTRMRCVNNLETENPLRIPERSSNTSKVVNNNMIYIVNRKMASKKCNNLEFGPVLDKLIFAQPMNIKNGTVVKLKKGRLATVCRVSNCKATVLVPAPTNVTRGVKVRVVRSAFQKR